MIGLHRLRSSARWQNSAWWLNSAWMLRCQKASRDFHSAVRNMEMTQRQLLQQILSVNEGTEFGREHGFRDIKSAADFQSRVPVRTYEQLSPWIERIARGEDNVLTGERVQLFQPTSGSVSAEKLIPYTASLRRQFQASIQAWICDLLTAYPQVRSGRAYWSISPALGSRRFTSGGVPIGFDDDEAYLSSVERWLVRLLLVMPAAVAQLTLGDAFRYITLLHLLAAQDLALISIWSPTFLTSLIAKLPNWSDILVSDLQRGKLSAPGIEQFPAALRSRLAPISQPRRAAELAATFRDCPRDQWAATIWPQLQLISCWADGSAAMYLPELRAFFSQPLIQPKGLIATEAFATFPSQVLGGAALAITSHFFEFVPADVDDADLSQPKLAHELEASQVYRLLLTTGGGLYRYDLGDLVEVTGHAGQCPLLRFLGRSGGVSDLVGEKLSEPFVAQSLCALFEKFNVVPRFATLAPVLGCPPSYRLYLQLNHSKPRGNDPGAMRDDLELALMRNPYYRHAVEIQQLAPVQIEWLESNQPFWQDYEARCNALGQRPGNIKPRALDTRFDWAL